jgi:hypothetical protein
MPFRCHSHPAWYSYSGGNGTATRPGRLRTMPPAHKSTPVRAREIRGRGGEGRVRRGGNRRSSRRLLPEQVGAAPSATRQRDEDALYRENGIRTGKGGMRGQRSRQ